MRTDFFLSVQQRNVISCLKQSDAFKIVFCSAWVKNKQTNETPQICCIRPKNGSSRTAISWHLYTQRLLNQDRHSALLKSPPVEPVRSTVASRVLEKLNDVHPIHRCSWLTDSSQLPTSTTTKRDSLGDFMMFLYSTQRAVSLHQLRWNQREVSTDWLFQAYKRSYCAAPPGLLLILLPFLKKMVFKCQHSFPSVHAFFHLK